MNGPGTVPPKVQNVYCTPSASTPLTSVVSRLTITFALPGRSTGGGTSGGEVRMAFTSVSAAAPAAPSRAWLCQIIAPPTSIPAINRAAAIAGIARLIAVLLVDVIAGWM